MFSLPLEEVDRRPASKGAGVMYFLESQLQVRRKVGLELSDNR